MQERWKKTYEMHARLGTFTYLKDKSKKLIGFFLDRCKAPYIAFSGGKDSTAMLILMKEMGLTNVPVFTQADDLDYPFKVPECLRITKHLGFMDHEICSSQVSALDKLKQSNMLTEIRGTFSHVAKEYTGRKKRTGFLVGLRKSESVGRRVNNEIRGNIYTAKDGLMRCTPLAEWSGMDVFALIMSAGCPYMPIYDHDDYRPPHEIRFSWMLNPRFASEGEVSFLKKYYPEQYQKLVNLNALISTYA